MNKNTFPKNVFTKKAADYTFFILFFLIFSFFIVFVIRPSLTSIFALKKEENELKRLDSLYEEKILNIASIQQQLENNIEKLNLLNQAIPDKPQINMIIGDIKKAADLSSFQIKKADVSDVNLLASRKNTLDTVKINIEGVSNFDNFLQFINYLISQRRLKTIEKVVISRDEQSTNSSQLKIVFDIEGYYL